MRSVPAIVRACLVFVILAGTLVINPQVTTAADGDVWSWGANFFGQLGNEGSEPESRPIATITIPGEVVAIEAGSHHTLALTADGTVYAWGANFLGQLGTGNYVDSSVPVMVNGLEDVTAISAGFLYSLALDTEGNVWAWGDNVHGQLGNDSPVATNVPAQIADLENITAISAGDEYALAIGAGGDTYAWGRNNDGQLGDNSTDDRWTPAAIPALDGIAIVQIEAGGSHSLALAQNGDLYAWGNNTLGQLGDGTTDNRLVPGLVTGVSDIVQIAAGIHHTLVLTSEQTVYAWGRNDFGQVGIGLNDNILTPQPVMDGIHTIAAGSWHSVALTPDGVAWAWGYNINYQLGDGTGINRNLPTLVDTTLRFGAITGGDYHTVAIEGLPPDSTSPDIELLDDQVLDPIDPFGAPVEFTVVATDDRTPVDQIVIACTDQDHQPFASGDIAPIGTTTITCTATDEAENTGSASFAVTVRSAGDLVDQLRALVNATPVGSSEKRTMLTYVYIIDGAIGGGNPQFACMTTNILDLYIRSQESRRRIASQQARLLYAETAQIRAVLGCGGPN